MHKNIFQTIVLCCFCAFSQLAQAQELIGLASMFDDSFVAWEIVTEDDDLIGSFRKTWTNSDNWTDWEYRLGEESGTIRPKWKEDPNQWEVRGHEEIITVRTVFKNDFSQWRLSNNDVQIKLERDRRYGINEWRVDGGVYGDFIMYTYYEDDPRDWVIEDHLSEDFAIEWKVALMYIIYYHSSPKI